MLLILFIRNLIIILNNCFSLLQLITKKSFKKILLFVLFYVLFNLYLIPTYASCDIDYSLLDRENNTYKGSKILVEEEDYIITEATLEYAQHVLDIVVVVCAFTIVIGTVVIYFLEK